MNSSRPYLLRAFFEWIVDNDLTPYLVIHTDVDGVVVPQAYVEDGRIILNISPDSVKNLLITNNHLEFKARFGGVEREIYAPIYAVQAIYAKENGRGMVFQDEDDWDDDGEDNNKKESAKSGKSGKPGKPTLTIVK